MKITFLISVTILFTLSVTACSEKKSPYAEPIFSTEISRYITCLERAAPRAHDSYERYLSWVDPDTGPSCEESHVQYGLYPLYQDSVAKCDFAVKEGMANDLSLPTLEQAAASFAKVNAELVPLAKKGSEYYLGKQYDSDACAQGKAIHAKLVALFKSHAAAERKLYDEINKVKQAAKEYEANKNKK